MGYRYGILGQALCCVMVLSCAARAAEVTERSVSVLREVKALERPITLTETKIPLGELIEKVEAQTDVRLDAVREVVDEPVAVVVKAMPARELLEQVAGLLEYRWRREEKEGTTRYEIYQDVAGRQREAALLEAEWAAVEKRLREELALHGELAALPPEEFQRLLDTAVRDLEAEARETPEQRTARRASPEAQARARRMEAARRLWTPANRVLSQFLGHLTPQQWAILRAEGRVRFASDPQDGELPLLPVIEQSLRGSPLAFLPPGTREHFGGPQHEALQRQAEDASRTQWAAAQGCRVTVRLDGSRMQREGSLTLRASAVPVPSESAAGFAFVEGPGTTVMLSASPDDDRRRRERAAERSPEELARLAADPVVGARRRFQPRLKPRTQPGGVARSLRFRELLPELAQTYGVQIISDAYWGSSPTVHDLASVTGPVSLTSLLDRWAGATHRWDHEGSRVRLRSRNWYFDRPREVPLRLVRQWLAIADEGRTLSLEEYAEAATTLTDTQLNSLAEVVNDADLPPRVLEWSNIYNVRHALRLYASFSLSQRQALWAGQVMPATGLLPHQRDLFLAAIREQPRDIDEPSRPDLSRWQRGGFSLTRQGMEWTRVGQGDSEVFGLRPAPAAADQGTQPGRCLPSDSGSAAARPMGGAARSVLSGPRLVTQLGFNMQFGPNPETRKIQFLRVASSP